MLKNCNRGSKKPDRKTVEKNRRIHMKNLCYKLYSLVPSLFSQPFKLFTQESQFDQSVIYIEQLREKIEVLKEKRDEALRLIKFSTCNNLNDHNQSARTCDGARPRMSVEVKEVDGGLQVFLINQTGQTFSFSKVISIVEDGGGYVVNSGYTNVGDKVMYTLHAKARVTRIGIEITGIRAKLQDLIDQ